MTSEMTNKFSAEVRARAVRMVPDHAARTRAVGGGDRFAAKQAANAA